MLRSVEITLGKTDAKAVGLKHCIRSQIFHVEKDAEERRDREFET